MSDQIYQGNDHKCYDFPKENFISADGLPIGTKVIVLCRRGSGSWTNYGNIKNKNHGYVKIDGIISSIDNSGERHIKLNPELVEKWRQPIGKETITQAVYGYANTILEVLK